MSWLNTWRTALGGITANKLRAALTALGIIIGVASVIATLALGNGARAAVEASFRFLGSDVMQISTKMRLKQAEFLPAGKPLLYGDGLGMTGAASLVDRVEMSVHAAGKIRHGRNVVDTGISGTTAEVLLSMALADAVQPVGWPEGQPVTADALLARGRFFSAEEVLAGAPVCVLGHQTALDLFQGDDPLEQTVWVNRLRCLVIGVAAELEMVDPSQRTQSKPNDAFLLPISTAIRNLYEREPQVMITAHIRDEARMQEAKQQIAAYLRTRHDVAKDAEGRYEDDFEITARDDVLGAQQQAASTFGMLLTAMAVVSLVVGGIGIMNVMLVSVTERTREIGVRMAVGARGRDIVAQFLAEAVLLSMAGGILGVAVGVLGIPLAAALNQGMALLAPDSIPLSLAVAVLTGLVFGIYPALRAARLDPMTALRSE